MHVGKSLHFASVIVQDCTIEKAVWVIVQVCVFLRENQYTWCVVTVRLHTIAVAVFADIPHNEASQI